MTPYIIKQNGGENLIEEPEKIEIVNLDKLEETTNCACRSGDDVPFI